MAGPPTAPTIEQIWGDAGQEFLDEYKRELNAYMALATMIEQLCRKLFKGTEIPHQVSSRVKTVKSLKKKVSKEISAFINSHANQNDDEAGLLCLLKNYQKLEADEVTVLKMLQESSNPEPDEAALRHMLQSRPNLKVDESMVLEILCEHSRLNSFEVKVFSTLLENPNRDIDEAKKNAMVQMLRERIRDRAGTRVLVYFPDDVSKAVEAIKNCAAFKDEGAEISFTKSRSDNRKKDQEEQREGGPLDYSLGAWVSYISLPTEEVIKQSWKHCGYRAAHLHVKLHQQLKFQWDSETAKENSESGENEEDEEGFDLGDVKAKFPEVSFQDLEQKLAEIQVTTVVMHAWSQVEHDIVYKNPYHIPINKTMLRMLDGINGLAITSEIMLDELGRTIEQARQEQELENTDYMSLVEKPEKVLLEVFGKYFGEGIECLKDEKQTAPWMWILCDIARSKFSTAKRTDISTPAKLRKFASDALGRASRKLNIQEIGYYLMAALGVLQERGHYEWLEYADMYMMENKGAGLFLKF